MNYSTTSHRADAHCQPVTASLERRLREAEEELWYGSGRYTEENAERVEALSYELAYDPEEEKREIDAMMDALADARGKS